MNLDVSNLLYRPRSAIILLLEPRQQTPKAGRQTDNKQNIPIVENLTPKNMSPDPPTILIPLLDQPIVPDDLGVEIKDLVGRVVDVVFGPLEDEEDVVVDEFVAAVQMHKAGHVLAVGSVQHLRGFEVEVAGPEFERFGKVGDDAAEVAYFEDFGGAWRERGWQDWGRFGEGLRVIAD